MDAILSIKPVYANQILAGTKKVEFRKRSFKEKVRRVYIYASVPVKQIVVMVCLWHLPGVAVLDSIGKLLSI